MKIIVVTALTPTPENRRGISALLYSLLRFRSNGIELKVYTLNVNRISLEEQQEISKQLSADVETISTPKTIENCLNKKWVARLQKLYWGVPGVNNLVSRDFIDKLKSEECDFVLLYPFYMSPVALTVPSHQCVVSGPDSEALNRSRRLANPFRLSTRKMSIDDFIYLQKNKALEKIWGAKNVWVHFVGMADYKFYCEVSGNTNAHFLLHPFVKYREKVIDFTSKEKLKVIIPGSYDMYYNVDVDKMLPSLIEHKDVLLKHFEFTFLGKHWSPIDQRLKEAGFDCEFKTWVDDYAEELVQHDIQITPISFGTGTKGKVLDAMVNGLLVIGSDYALENICVRDMESCVRYRDASHIASILISVANHRERYQTIAEKGRSQVLKYHDPARISKRFFEIYYRELTGKKLSAEVE